MTRLLRSARGATERTSKEKEEPTANVVDPASALRMTREWGDGNDNVFDKGWHLMDFSEWEHEYLALLDGQLSLGDPSSSNADDEDTVGPTLSPSTPPAVHLTEEERAAKILEKCDMTEPERSQNIFQVLVSISTTPEDLTDPLSPRYFAFQWIDEVDDAILCPPPSTTQLNESEVETGLRFIQRYTLALLYFAMNGPKWTFCSLRQEGPCEPQKPNINSTCVERTPLRYLDSSHECFWYGSGCGLCDAAAIGNVTVDDYIPLLKINLPDNNLAGTIPVEVFEQLTHLELLGLDGNRKIRGKLPSAIGDLSRLRSLSLDGANLRGSLPEELFQLVHLRALDLQGNRFSGTLSTSIGNLDQLHLLQLDNNQLDGAIPSHSLLQLPNLVVVSVSGNNMVGSLESICEQAGDNSTQTADSDYWNVAVADCAASQVEAMDPTTPPLVECSCCDACATGA